MEMRAALFGFLLTLGSCSPAEEPPIVRPPAKPKTPPPAPVADVRPPVPPPAPLPTPTPPPPRPPPPPPPRPAPRDDGPPSEQSSPTFIFRGLNCSGEVLLNGEPAGELPLRWWISEKTVFDPKLAGFSWPPAGAALLSTTEERRDDGLTSAAELWISGSPAEYVLYVRTRFGPVGRQGALRLRVPGCRHVFYTPPTLTRESEDFHKYNRTIWFERE